MKRLRKIIFWCHLLVGATAGIVILIMSVTGVLLTYERQIVNWADTRGYHVAPPAPGEQHLPAETLIARASELQPGVAAATLTMRADPAAPASVGFANGRTLFINPYTGEIFGEGSKGVRGFFRTVTDWHRWLGASSENRASRRAITGACNLGFLFIVVSGFYLWWPRRLQWSQIRNVIWFKRGLSGKARDFNWHNAIGSWCVLPLFIVVLSAVVISYPWASNLVYRLYGEEPPPARTASAPASASAESQAAAALSLDGLSRLWERAETQTSGWQSISMRVPASTEAPVVFTIDHGNGGQPQKRAQLTLERATGEVVRWEPFASYSAGRRMRSWLRFAHTGEAAGLLGQTIAGMASLGSVVLVYTGVALALRRFRGWQARRPRHSTPVAYDPPSLAAEADARAQPDS